MPTTGDKLTRHCLVIGPQMNFWSTVRRKSQSQQMEETTPPPFT